MVRFLGSGSPIWIKTDMKMSRFVHEHITGFRKQAEAGMPVKELCNCGGFSDATF